MRLLLDEMLSPAIARELQARGYDLQAVAAHPEREALPDPEVLALARAERRAVVTNNVRDFRPLHAEAVMPGGPGHYGMIFMSGNYRRTRSDQLDIDVALIYSHGSGEAPDRSREGLSGVRGHGTLGWWRLGRGRAWAASSGAARPGMPPACGKPHWPAVYGLSSHWMLAGRLPVRRNS